MDFFHIYLRGMRRYVLNERDDTMQDALKQYARRKLIHNFVKCSFILLIVYGIYLIFRMFVN